MESKVEVGIFVKDKNTRGLHIPFEPQQFYFPFIRINPSKSENLKLIGAEYVVQSFLKTSPKDRVKTKVLHSGLLKVTGYNNCYFGDNVNLKSNRKDFFIMNLKDGSILTMYYFRNKKPQNKLLFTKNFLNGITKMNCSNEKATL